jgi:MoaA/NifB/PqqE/SkfB family radical SAM enzyme
MNTKAPDSIQLEVGDMVGAFRKNVGDPMSRPILRRAVEAAINHGEEGLFVKVAITATGYDLRETSKMKDSIRRLGIRLYSNLVTYEAEGSC